MRAGMPHLGRLVLAEISDGRSHFQIFMQSPKKRRAVPRQRCVELHAWIGNGCRWRVSPNFDRLPCHGFAELRWAI